MCYDAYARGWACGFAHGVEHGKWDTIYDRACDDYAVHDDPYEPHAYHSGYCHGFESGYHTTFRLHAHTLLQLQRQMTWARVRAYWIRAHENRALLEPQLFNTIASFFES